MLSERWPVELVPQDEWRPCPPATDREAWGAIDGTASAAFLAAGEAALDAPWPRLTATVALDFVRNGDRGSYENPHFARRAILRDLVLAECVERAGRFLDPIADALWSICEETWWGWTAATGFQRRGAGLPDVTEQYFDLGVGESAAMVAWVAYLLGDALDGVSPLLRERVTLEVQRRVIDPFLERDDYWWAATSSNWNTWCHSNALLVALLLEPDESRREAVVAKVLRGLDTFVADYPADGGCDEGPTYWTRAGGALFEALELLDDATGGAFRVWDEPLIGEIGRFVVRAHIVDEWYVNFADGGARLRMPGTAVFRFGRAIGDPAMVGLGAEAARRSHALDPRMTDGFTGNPTRTLPSLFGDPTWRDETLAAPMLRDVWLPDIQVMTARDRGGDGRGLFVAAKAGHNDEHHNHNDVGSVIVFLDGEPVLIDAGVGTYTAKTFGPDRYDIWTMQSAWHNLPVINDVQQRAGASFRATSVEYASSDERAELRCDLAGAYPPDAAVESWTRTVALQRGVQVEIIDEYRLAAGSFALHLLTASATSLVEPGMLRVGHALVRYDPAVLSAAFDEHTVEEPNLRAVWGDTVTRIRLTAASPGRSGTVRVSVAPA